MQCGKLPPVYCLPGGALMDGLARAWNPARQCTGTNRQGERCRRQPIPGGEVCVLHGGAVPVTQDAAKRRLLAMVEPVMSAFEEILDSWHRTTCATCGHPTGDVAPVIRIGQLVLDRSGFHPTLTLEQAPPPNPFANVNEDDLIVQLEQLLETARENKRRHDAMRVVPEATDALLLADAFVVPDDDDAPIHEPDVPIPLGKDNTTEGKDEK